LILICYVTVPKLIVLDMVPPMTFYTSICIFITYFSGDITTTDPDVVGRFLAEKNYG